MVEVRVLEPFGPYKKGDIFNLHKERLRAYVAKGLVELVNAPAPEPAPAPKLVAAVKQRKRFTRKKKG